MSGRPAASSDDDVSDVVESPDVTTFSYLCIGCPLGCRLELDETGSGDVVEIRGSSCRRGDRYRGRSTSNLSGS